MLDGARAPAPVVRCPSQRTAQSATRSCSVGQLGATQVSGRCPLASALVATGPQIPVPKRRHSSGARITFLGPALLLVLSYEVGSKLLVFAYVSIKQVEHIDYILNLVERSSEA